MQNVNEQYLKAIFAANVKSKMREQKLTQQKFALMLGTTQTMVSRWLSGVNYPGSRTYADICRSLKVSPSDLLKDPKVS